MTEPEKSSAWALLGATLARLFWFAAAVAAVCIAVAFGYGRLVTEAIAVVVAMVAHARQQDRVHECETAITELNSSLGALRERLTFLEDRTAKSDP